MTFPPDPESLLATGPEAHPAPRRKNQRKHRQRQRQEEGRRTRKNGNALGHDPPVVDVGAAVMRSSAAAVVVVYA